MTPRHKTFNSQQMMIAIALISGLLCCHLGTQPDLTPLQSRLFETSIVIFQQSSQALLGQRRKK